MGGCAAINCSNHSRKNIRMFRFPSEGERRKKWIVNCRRKDWDPGLQAQLCICHFEESQFEVNRADNWKKLKSTAVPTLFDVPNPPQTFALSRKKGIGCPKPGTILDLHQTSLTNDIENEDPYDKIKKLNEKVESLERQNKLMSEELENKNRSLSFLSDEQLVMAAKKPQSITHWSKASIIKGFKLRFALGKHGYNYLRSTGYPAPSYSTLNRRVSSLKLDFGILNSILQVLKTKVDGMDIRNKYCCLIVDEMDISANYDFDTTSKTFVGKVTLGKENDVGNHYIVVLLRGLMSPWKQVIAHEITGASTAGPVMAELTSRATEAARAIGLEVKATVSDMASSNQAMWRSFGVAVTRNARNTSYTVGKSNELIHSIADIPHLLKNLRNAFLKRVFILPNEIYLRENLPTKIVSAGYIKQLWISEIDSESSLRSLHHLNKAHLFPTHFQTMNVALAVQLFSIKTAAAVEKAVYTKEINKNALTAAWFIRLVHQWFQIMSARHCKKGITFKNMDSKFEFLEDFMKIIQETQFGLSWKPIQTGILMSTSSVVNLSKECFSKDFKYFLPGRLSQDVLENVFSQIRRKSATKPTALGAKRALKMICVSQFLSDIKNSNYASDSDTHLLDYAVMLDQNSKKITEETVKEDLNDNTPQQTGTTKPMSALTVGEENDIFYIAGATLNAMLKRQLCVSCKHVESVLDPKEPSVPRHRILLTRQCDLGGLKTPTSGIYKICREAERMILQNKQKLISCQIGIDKEFVEKIMERCEDINLRTCCKLKENIINYYIVVRCKGIKSHLINKKAHAASFGSSSVHKKQKLNNS